MFSKIEKFELQIKNKNDFWRRYFNLIKTAAGILLFTVLLMTVMGLIHTSNEFAKDEFFASDGCFFKIAFNSVFIVLLFCAFTAITRSLGIANAVVTVLLSVFSYAVNVVCIITGDPLLPSDFVLAGSLDNIVSFVELPVQKTDIAAAVIVVLSVAAGFVFFGRRLPSGKPKLRIPAVVLSVAAFSVLLYFFGFNHKFVYDILPKFNVWVTATDHKEDYVRNGALLSFIPKMGDLTAPKIEGYSKAAIDDIKKGFKDRNEFYHYDDVKPDVIVIQNEAWWDPTKLTDVHFSADPLEYYRSGAERTYTGEMITPVFAGGTCMPEFEYLTGFNTIFLPANCYPYIQAITSDTPSIARVFGGNGYQTEAIHTFKKSFYGRNKAYNFMGFDNFTDVSDIENPEQMGFYVSDREMANEIIRKYESRTKDNIFIYGITMQNHGDYEKPRYGWHDIEVTSETLSADELSGIRDFTQGVRDADRMFRQLTEYFADSERPVVIMMYGDHLPLLGNEGSTYVSGGMIKDGGAFDYKKHEELFKTPYIIWSNYDLSPEYNIAEIMSPQTLSMLTMRLANFKSVPWFYFLFDEFYEKYPVYSRFVVKNSAFETVDNISDEDWATTFAYKLVQYDLIYGKKYSEK